ncbi:mitochondrial ATP synthase epsilon chain domain-containing protein [Histoplasma ohiense]|nr:mitochondrial ATP synthase epsilon chain domain-containing protein [Histoplasma ohiense (nom. inval.)]
MAFSWKSAGLTYNRYLAVSARAVRRSLKEAPRAQAERREEMDLKFSQWQNGKQGEVNQLSASSAAETQAATTGSK